MEPVRHVVARVAPVDLASRSKDEQPAEVKLQAADFGGDGRLDLPSLRVTRYDPATEKETSAPLPWRWYDDAIPYDFPECEQNAHATDGVNLHFVSRPRWGDFYNLLGDGAGGRLVWTHTQQGGTAAVYRITFRLLPKGQSPDRLPPRGFVGDGSHRCAETAGQHHRHVPRPRRRRRLGRRRAARPARRRLPRPGPVLPEPRHAHSGRSSPTLDSCPRPTASRWTSASPRALWPWTGTATASRTSLSGAERNRALFFRNSGTARAPRLVNQGFVLADGKPLALPVEPVPKSPKGVYELDYFPTLEAVDWNGDGRTDLLCGGYITGRIYLYENVGGKAVGAPRLKFAGPLEADGKPLNVGDWAAAPSAADLDGDGDLDLVTGNMPLNAGGGDATDPDRVLRYYENVGTRQAPRLVERTFPKTGKFPYVSLAAPRAADLNGDGLLDLAVSAGENVYLWFNTGTRSEPKFAVHDQPLQGHWGSDPLPTFGLQFLSRDGDGPPAFSAASRSTATPAAGDSRASRCCLRKPGRPSPRQRRRLDVHAAGRPRRRRPARPALRHARGHHLAAPNLGGKPRASTSRATCWARGRQADPGRPDGRAEDGLRRPARCPHDVLGRRLRRRRPESIWSSATPTARCATIATSARSKSRSSPPGRDRRHEDPHDPVRGRLGRRRPHRRGRQHRGRRRGVLPQPGRRPLRRSPSPSACPSLPYGPFAAVTDWNGDGDADLIVGTGYGYFCWFERSFLERGYAKAELVSK